MLKAKFVSALAGLGLALTGSSAFGAIGATATITETTLAPSTPQQYQYSITLTNTGTTPIGTFWFSWIPSYDLLPTAPLTISTPTVAWTGIDAPDDFGTASVQWVNTVTPLQPGNSLSGFNFTSTDSPATIDGTSNFFGLPVKQSYVYIGAPETDPGFALVPTTVTPEPATIALLLGIPAGLLARRKRS